MSRKYKINDQRALYFVTFTVIHWIDVFIRNEYRDVFVGSVQYCQKEKGLEVYGLSPDSYRETSHIHMIVGSDGKFPLEGIIRDMKSFTSRSIRELLEEKESVSESRREWMYWIACPGWLSGMQRAGLKNSNNKDFQLWQQHNHPIELSTKAMIDQKMEYIHMNPVYGGFVNRPEAWMYGKAMPLAQ